ncbi:MAG: alpha/beta fold hydrolase [Myxococcota bacterium]
MIRTSRLTFPGAGGTELAARYDAPVGPVRATALFAHCFTCSKDFVAASRVSRALAERGFGVLRFDFTGLGHSAGEFENTSFSSNVDDLVAAADHLRNTVGAPALLVGHSLGGTAVLAGAARIPEAAAVVTIGSPADPAHVRRLLVDALPGVESEGVGEVELAGRRFRIRREMIEDLERHPLAERIASLRKALLVMHAPLDAQVGIDNASEIFLAAKHPKSFVSLDGADHLLTRAQDADYAAGVIASWAARYLPAEAADSAGEAEPGEVTVTETDYGRYANDIQIGPHRLRADEPPSVGGDDSGPTPYGLLSAALGACTTMTMRMYADRKKWPLERVSVSVRHAKIHAKDCESCETETGKVDRFERALRIEGPSLSDDQRARLVEIADRCPVHRTLHSEVEIRTRVLD